MSSQYYRVTAYVGTPHRNAVEVTIPLVGPAGPAGPAGTGLETLTTPGDTLYQGVSTGQRLPIGASGQILKVVGGFPAWANESGAVTSVNGETGSVVLDAAEVGALSIPTRTTHSFTQSGQTLTLSPSRAQFIHINMSFSNGSAQVNMPTSGSDYDEVVVNANVGTNCTLTVGGVVLANTNQFYGITRRLLRFVRTSGIWQLYEHPYHTHTTNELIFATPPQLANSPARAGTISYAAGNLYVAVADNEWRRVPLAAW
jgi:hypothetical protein